MDIESIKMLYLADRQDCYGSDIEDFISSFDMIQENRYRYREEVNKLYREYTDKTSISKEELMKKLQPYLEKDEWIIDGNYHHTLTQRLKYATDVFFLDIPREECIKGMIERIDIERDDIPWVETREDAEELIAWTEDYEKRHKVEEEQMLKENKQVVVHRFNSRDEINAYLESIKK